MGGTIHWVYSERMGNGYGFKYSLPFQKIYNNPMLTNSNMYE